MSSHHNFAFSRMTFGSNLYIPPPNLSIRNGRITQVSSHPSNQMNFQRNSSEENLSNVDTLIYYPIRGKTNDMQLPNKTLPNNYRPVTPPNNYPQVNLPKDYATVTQITKHASIPQNSKTLIKDLMPSQEKNENVLIPPMIIN